MQGLVDHLQELFLREGTLVDLLLCVGLWWQTKQLEKERRQNRDDAIARAQAREKEATERVEAFKAIGSALNEMRGVLTQLAERTSELLGRRR